MPVYACCLGNDCNRDLIIQKVLKLLKFWFKKVAYEKSHLLNGVQIHLSMEEENQPQQKKDYSIILHLLLKGLHVEFSEKDLKLSRTD